MERLEPTPLPPNDPSPAAFHWHPKLTPYRIVVLITTGGLGITKAIFVSKGETVGSTTVEWITGVVLALLFQFLDSYERNLHRSGYIDWMFSYDCLNALTICRRWWHTAIDGPTQNVPHVPEFDTILSRAHTPLVTPYRLLVSGIFTCFGLAKMLCAYLGLSTETSVLDLLLGVPLTLSIYYLGLFEEQASVNALRNFFNLDYSIRLKRAVALLVVAATLALCLSWVTFWYWSLTHALRLPSTPTHDVEYWTNAFPLALYTLRRIIIFLSLSMIQVGVLACLLLVFGLSYLWWPAVIDWDAISHFIILGFWLLEYVTCIGMYPYGLSIFSRIPPLAETPQPELGALGVIFKEDEKLAKYMALPLGFMAVFFALIALLLLMFFLLSPFLIRSFHVRYNQRRAST